MHHIYIKRDKQQAAADEQLYQLGVAVLIKKGASASEKHPTFMGTARFLQKQVLFVAANNGQ